MNEYVSDEDIKKYELESVWLKVKGCTPLQYAWTNLTLRVRVGLAGLSAVEIANDHHWRAVA